MGRKIFLWLILLGIITVCVGTTSDDIQPSTSTSVSVSTVTRKVTWKPVLKLSHADISTNETTFTTTATPFIQKSNRTSLRSLEDGTAATKPLRMRKKILASNLKNSTEKVVLQNDKHEKQNLLNSVVNFMEGSESKDSGKANSSESTEEDILEEGVAQNQNKSVEILSNKKSNKELNEKDEIPEGRSLESLEEGSNSNVKEKAPTKTKASINSSERTTKGLMYESYGGLQKVLNSNYLNNNEGYENKADIKVSQPSPLGTSSEKKSTPISGDNAVKNAIKFESEYYGHTGQTDWVPIVPNKLPSRPVNGADQLGNRVKLVLGEKTNNTLEQKPFVFPSDNAQGPKETNVILLKEKEIEKTTIRLRNNVEKRTRAPNSTESVKSSTIQPNFRQPIKFRGTVRYRSSQSNSSHEDKKFQNETILKRSNSTVIDIPITGASWTLATLRGSIKTTEKPEETTEISVFTVTNHTSKSQNIVGNSLVVPPENIKLENGTKDQQPLKIPSFSTVSEDVAKDNKTEKIETMPKLIDGWNTMVGKDKKSGNVTDVVVSKSVDVNQVNDTVLSKTSTLESATVVIEDTTKKLLTTENFSEPTTEFTFLEEVSSQSSVNNNSIEKIIEFPVTTVNDKTSVTEVTETFELLTEVLGTTVKPTSEEETYTENEFATMGNDDAGSTKKSVIKFKSESEANTTLAKATTIIFNEKNIFNTTTSKLPYIKQNFTSTETIPTKMNTTAPPPVLTSSKPYTTSSKIFANSTFVISSPKTSDKIPVTTGSSTTTLNTERSTTSLSTTTSNTERSTITSFVTTPVPIPSKNFPKTAAPIPTVTFSTITTPTTAAITTTSKSLDKNLGTTEESIYYKNYIPTTTNPHTEITEESVPAYLRLTVQAASWEELCRLKEELRESIMNMLGGKNVSADSIHFLNLNDQSCQEKIEESKANTNNGTIFLPVNMFLMDKYGDFDKNLSEAFLTLWGRRGLDFELPIRKVDFVTPIVNLTELAEPPLGGSVVAAIVISCVAGICVILLGILFVVMKRRQKRFNYGQRCTPVSLDAYSLDSVSIYNSVRRKGMRASKRSYGNAAFDDPEIPTHQMNFAGLANFSLDKEQLYEEFSVIPQVYPKVEELPPGAETKNRYANVIPLPETRVHLTVKDGDPVSDYINANYVRGPKGIEKLYIACQAPMDSTVDDFWRMIWEQQCKVILMLTDLKENGIEKCADYLPPNEVTDNLRLFGDFQVTLKKRDVKEKYIISNLILKNMEANLWREVTHLWYLGWPDQGVPSEANSLIAFLIEARSQMKIQNGATTSSPAVVHCSPGTGRTGTVIACDLCIREYEQSRMVDIPKCVFNLRRDRAGSVQTKDQYAFIYQVLNVYATKLSGGGIESI